MRKAPQDKTESYRLYHAGAFGNKLKAWATFGAFIEDYNEGRWPEDKPVALRLRRKPDITPPSYCIPLTVKMAVEVATSWVASGVCLGLNYIELNEVGRDDLIVLQGEVLRDHNGWQLRYSLHKTIMRHAWPHHEDNLSGLRALHKIKSVMCTASYENLMRLFDEYDSPGQEMVVEFSTYSQGVGELGHNTVFWEVRGY